MFKISYSYFRNIYNLFENAKINLLCYNQGTNARKVISEVYAFFVLQCTVFGRKRKHKTDVTA